MIVRLDLHENVDRLGAHAVDTSGGVGEIERSVTPGDDRRIVPIGRKNPGRTDCVRVADHVEQGFIARLAIDDPARVEDLVAAMLGVRLREHHELDVRRVALEPREAREQVIHLIGG